MSAKTEPLWRDRCALGCSAKLAPYGSGRTGSDFNRSTHLQSPAQTGIDKRPVIGGFFVGLPQQKILKRHHPLHILTKFFNIWEVQIHNLFIHTHSQFLYPLLQFHNLRIIHIQSQRSQPSIFRFNKIITPCVILRCR